MNEDDLTEWLTPRPPTANEPSPQELFARTHGVFRARLRRRKILLLLSIICCFLAGLVAGRLTGPTETVVIRIESPVLPTPEAIPPPVPPKEAIPEASAAQLEMQAELCDDPAETAALFRNAGDKYLNIERDYPRAARCYRLHLQALNSPNAAPQPEDTWLLASLKPLPR